MSDKVKTKHGEFDVKPLSFKERRELHKLEIQAANIDGEMDFGKYIEMIDWILRKALINPEQKLEGLDDNQIDDVGSELYTFYKNSNKKKTKKSE
jgi:hypothetical protein|tara:strand:+ start:51 stop:335 length:285 start_codon:yes stop_codon:yes gene_type:complete